MSRVPEEKAIAAGQKLLRLLPVDRFAVFEKNDPRLRTVVDGVVLQNPLILSAMYYDIKILSRAMGLGFGAVTTKSITTNSRPGHPAPNIVRRDIEGPGLVNCNGFENPGLNAFKDSVARLHHRTPLIISVAGETSEDYLKLITEFGVFADLIEINVSSPNTRLVYEWNNKPTELRNVLTAARQLSPVPLILKLSPDFAGVNEDRIMPSAIEAGVHVFNYGNTRRIDDLRLSQRFGGLSGPELFDNTLQNLRKSRARFGSSIDIIATGGVDSPGKALLLMQEGATAIGYFTAFITKGPFLARQILDALAAQHAVAN